ncbi:fibrobacter succinogenes major paralogous domain-containing protein [Sphingobacterium chungjuense]|uniref:hypothetical protein n=1 Tax=Sphingobacterium chungjuense TaxID=2675553 RepID=UPI001409F6A0|nr:hypothetical protein [Sphingobacterium chungjuense]
MKIILHSIVLLFLLSCKSENLGNRSPGVIQVGISEVSFESEGAIGNRAVTPTESTIQRNTIELNNNLLMVAELRPVEPVTLGLKDGAKAALDTTALSNNIRYRLLVYNQAGAFVTERNYIHGQESSTEPLILEGDNTYTFVAFSFNSTADDLPAVTPAAATRTLANSQISVPNTGRTDYMYFRQTMTVVENTINRLNIVLKHRKPQITPTINSSETGYNITAIAAHFTPHNDGMGINLSNGTYTQIGSVSEANITSFSSLNTQNVVGAPAIINAPSNQATIFTITSMTIGPLTLSNLVPFTNLTVTAGVRYNLILNIVPRDEYTVREGVPSARINGRIWALHNVGVPTTLDANPLIITAALHGNYYQFGRNLISAAPTSNTVNANWTNTPAAANAWNMGSETAVSKSDANDPCPSGFRLPTRTNMQELLDGVVITFRGPTTEGNANFSSATILTSKRNANVVLVLPNQGYMNLTGTNPPVSTGITGRGSTAHYWTSSSLNSQGYRLLINTTSSDVSVPIGNFTFVQSRPIRCTATLATNLPPQS